ncbi:hypothetical protein [Rahnella sp. PCH160]|uniref:hypothetical protein n=1 Tax=Rahnella sp. PCH160 TaxID=3447928 RepID=UPI0039FC778A
MAAPVASILYNIVNKFLFVSVGIIQIIILSGKKMSRPKTDMKNFPVNTGDKTLGIREVRK